MRSPDTLVNLTPHPIRIYGANCPDRILPGTQEPVAVIPAGDAAPVRLRAEPVGRAAGGVDLGPINIPVNVIKHTSSTALPERRPGTWYVVSLVVALANPDRTDLLVPDEAVRDTSGAVAGCRALAITVKSARIVIADRFTVTEEWGVHSDDGEIYRVDPPTRETAEREAALLRMGTDDDPGEPGAAPANRCVLRIDDGREAATGWRWPRDWRPDLEPIGTDG